MADSDLLALSLEGLSRLIAAREVSPVEATQAALDQIDRLQPDLNAFITVTPEHALEGARRAEAEIAAGRNRGPLHGVPVALKDLFQTRGIRTTAGSPLLVDWVPDEDAAVVTRLLDAGVVMLGKLHMHELAYGTRSDNRHFGPARNPWDRTRTPGGSSGGSAIAVTTGMAWATLGSDTGGSIRIPASECGCVGLMASSGRVSNRGVVPLSWTMDHVGPLTRTVRDAAIVLQAIAGYDAGDPQSVDRPAPDFLADIEVDASSLVLGRPSDFFWDALSSDVAPVLEAALTTLTEAGAMIRPTPFERAGAYSRSVGLALAVEASAAFDSRWPDAEPPDDPRLASSLDSGRRISAVEHAQALQTLRLARAGEADRALEGVDVLVVPTLADPPPTFAELEQPDYPVHRTHLTSLLDLTGQPVATVPCGLTSGRLPVGLSFVGRRFDEVRVLQAARAFERARGALALPPQLLAADAG